MCCEQLSSKSNVFVLAFASRLGSANFVIVFTCMLMSKFGVQRAARVDRAAFGAMAPKPRKPRPVRAAKAKADAQSDAKADAKSDARPDAKSNSVQL